QPVRTAPGAGDLAADEQGPRPDAWGPERVAAGGVRYQQIPVGRSEQVERVAAWQQPRMPRCLLAGRYPPIGRTLRAWWVRSCAGSGGQARDGPCGGPPPDAARPR